MATASGAGAPASRSASERSRRNASGLTRDIEILDALADGDAPDEGLGVVRLAAVLGRDKATVSRALSTLAEAGLVERDPDTLTYRIGHRIFALAAASAESRLAREARPYLRLLARHSRETAHLSVLSAGAVLTLISELSPNEVRTASWEGRRADPLRSPSGRVLVSDWSDAEVSDWFRERQGAVMADDDPRLDPLSDTPTPPSPVWLDETAEQPTSDLAALLRETERIRRRGFTTSDEELEVGVVAASAPVRDHTGRIVAAINVSAPKGRIGGHLDRLGIYVARAGERLSAHLGAPPRRADG